MKININYELMNEIRTANTGFNLKRYAAKMGMYAGIISVGNIISLSITGSIKTDGLLFGVTFPTSYFAISELITSPINKQIACERLEELSALLQKINIYTSPDLLKQATAYKTQYEISKEDGTSPRIIQKKYMMVPTNGLLNSDETSLQQEHTIGSRQYVLSIGTPKESRALNFLGARQITK